MVRSRLLAAHNEIDQSIQNRAVFFVIFSQNNVARFLRVIHNFSLHQQTRCHHRVSNFSRVPCCARKCRDCSLRLGTRLQQFSCSRSRFIHAPRLERTRNACKRRSKNAEAERQTVSGDTSPLCRAWLLVHQDMDHDHAATAPTTQPDQDRQWNCGPCGPSRGDGQLHG